ncbi:MAG: NfeD family protein [Pseudomonadota bacterium]
MSASSGSGLWRIGAVMAIIWAWAMLGAAAPAPGAAPTTPERAAVLVLAVDGAIGPATTEYLRDGLAAAKARGAPLVILSMDTPGGLDSATRDIIADILASPTPVATYVNPAGARAASAGTYILYASHLAAMAPGTHLGAATPVQMGGGGSSPLPGSPDPEAEEGRPAAKGQDAMSAKVINDSAAYIASLAALHGRNAEWAERAVREAATLTSRQALEQNVIEVIAGDVPSLLRQADGRTVSVQGRPHVLATAGASVERLEPDWRIKALSVITDPNIAFLLLIVGVYGLIFEFMTPGSIGPGVVGAVALLVAMFALNMLPVNYAGLALLLLGIALMTAEVLTPTLGVLGIGGAVAFGLGSLFLFKGPIPEFRLSPAVAVTASLLSLAFFVLALGAVWRTRRAAVAIGPATLVGAAGRVVSWSNGHGLVQAQGEEWQATSRAELEPGQIVRIVGREGVGLQVEPVSAASQERT